jgi:hypothetical protein
MPVSLLSARIMYVMCTSYSFHQENRTEGSTCILAKGAAARCNRSLSFERETGLEGPGNCFILTTSVHFTDRLLRNRRITTRSKKVQKGPQTNHRKRSGPLATTRLPTASLLAGHHTTTGEQSHLERHGEQKLRSIEAKEGCPTPIEPERGDERKPPQPVGEQLLKTNQTTVPSAVTRSPGSADEPEEAEDKKAAAENYCTGRRGQQEAQPSSDLPPPPPATTTAGQEGGSHTSRRHPHSPSPPRPVKSDEQQRSKPPRPAPTALIGGARPPPVSRRAPREERGDGPHGRPSDAAPEHRRGRA